MFSKRVEYALNHFIEEGYFLPVMNTYHLKERKDSGKSDLYVTVQSDNLCIDDFDSHRKCNFLRTDSKNGMQKVWITLFLRKTMRYGDFI